MKSIIGVAVLVACGLGGCRNDPALTAYEFRGRASRSTQLGHDQVMTAARLGLRADEELSSATPYSAPGMGQTVVQAVAEDRNDSRAYVVDEDGVILPSREFWAKERAAEDERFGKMTPALYDRQQSLANEEAIEVEIFLYADVPEPQLPVVTSDQVGSIQAFEAWTSSHAASQVPRIAAAKARLIAVLDRNGANILSNPHALPTIRARVSAELLRSTELNASDVVEIDAVSTEPQTLLGYAGRASMASLGPDADHPPSPFRAGLNGGACGAPCNGGRITVGLLEKESLLVQDGIISGLARNNTRINPGGTDVTGYFECPTACSTDSDCPDIGEQILDLARRCKAPVAGAQKVCVQDHLSWVAASVGMFGSYDYSSTIPEARTNVPAGTTVFPSTGAWFVNYRIGNADDPDMGLDFLVQPPAPDPDQPCQQASAPPAVYVNHSVTSFTNNMNFVGRAFGTFFAAAAGNKETGTVACAQLKNGVCVGMFDYELPYDDETTHRRTSVPVQDVGSSFVNNTAFDPALERPHLLGPGTFLGDRNGLHMPAIDVAPGSSQMRTAAYPAPNQPPADAQILGTSFSTPTVLSVAIQAHQFKGWFTELAYPMVNKAVLLASTRDANNDGAVGTRNVWSQNAPSVDAEDGAGQIRFDRLQTILTNNQFYWNDLSDGIFVSCGTGCRKVTVTSLTIPALARFRVAMAWQTCMVDRTSVPELKNDLDLALNCGSPLLACGGTTISNTATSEVEMLERPGCIYSRSCSIEIRIKNGDPIRACGSTSTERVGVAWSFDN